MDPEQSFTYGVPSTSRGRLAWHHRMLRSRLVALLRSSDCTRLIREYCMCDHRKEDPEAL
jgi:hypothetical protein